MRGLLLSLAVMAAAFPAWSRPRVTPPNGTRPYAVTVTFETGDTSDSEAIPVSGFCTVRYQQVSGDDASLYSVPTADTATGSGTLIASFTASTTSPVTFSAGTRWVKAVATDATAGGSVLTVECAPMTGNGSSGGTYNVASYGTVADGVTNDVAAINRAIDAACDAGGGIVYFPPGVYGIGSTGSGVFYSGIQVTCSDIVLLGSPFASELRPLFTHGGAVIAACPAFTNTPAYGTNQDCSSAADISGVRIEGLYIHDDDPSAHCLTYSAASGTCSSEETHGIYVRDCDGCVVTGNRIESMGDEGISMYGDYGKVTGNFVTDTPSIRGGSGSGILANGIGITITDNAVWNIQADPLGDAGNCTTACDNFGRAITVSTDTTNTSREIVVANNSLQDIDAYWGILVSTAAANADGITIEGNAIEMNSTDTLGCIETAMTIANRRRCAVSILGASGTPTRNRILVQGNTANAGMNSTDEGALGSVSFVGNTLTGDFGYGITAAGGPLLIENNYIASFEQSGIYITGMEVDGRTESVVIKGNTLFENNDDGTAENMINAYKPGTNCGTDTVIPGGVLVDGNIIQASATATSVEEVIDFDPCARVVFSNNIIDYRSAATTTADGIANASQVRGNYIKNSGRYGILVSSVSGAVIDGNQVEASANRGIFSSGAADTIITNNLIHGNVASNAIDASGQRPICLGNISKSNDGTDRTIVCGETAPSGAGCSADGADAGGLCDFNQVCNTGDTGC